MATSVKLPQINGKFKGQDILSLSQFDPTSLQILFKHTADLKRLAQKGEYAELLKGNLVTLLFYEPSSRTFGSFSSSIKRLGGQTIAIADAKQSSSVAKGETLPDTMGVFQTYSDAIVLRHPQTGAAAEAAQASSVPIFNAGDGIGEHPTQGLLDLFTIYERFGSLDNLNAVFAGDILNGRTIHSILRGLSLYKGNTAYLLSPKELQLTQEEVKVFEAKGVSIVQIEKETDIPTEAHFWYWTRVQKERFKDLAYYEKVKHRYVLTKKLLEERGNKDMVIMHPLPRVGEILEEVDSDPRAIYFRDEIQNGVYLRMALVSLVLGKLT